MGSSGKDRRHVYNITLSMSPSSDDVILDSEKVYYPGSGCFFDTFTIRKNEIVIKGSRSSKLDLSVIFYNHQSALYRQLIKALLFYYCSVCQPNKITKVTVTRKKGSDEDKKIYNEGDIRQIVSLDADLSELSKLKDEKVKSIFLETSKSRDYLHALTFLIKSMSISNAGEIFENQWKSFNAIYKSVAGKSTDFECLSFIRQHMINNPGMYPLLLSKVRSFKADEVRELRWIKLIHNDFSNIEKVKAFRDFVIRNEDHRLMFVFEQTLSVREEFLKQKGYYDEVVKHIAKNNNKVVDTHLAATLCLKYAYFCRNKMVHAEGVESSFRIIEDNKSEKEMKWISSIVMLMIFDLVNNC